VTSSTGGSAPAGGEENQAVDIELAEIRSRFKDRWVAIAVTKRDKNLQPIRGTVIADDSDRYRLRQKLMSTKEACIFFAGEPQYPLLL
jgi:hypothetical protein